MIHFGKEPSGDLQICISPDEVGEIYGLLQTAGLLQRRTFDALGRYIRQEYADELEHHRRRMTAQIPGKVVVKREQSGACSSYAECEQALRNSGMEGEG